MGRHVRLIGLLSVVLGAVSTGASAQTWSRFDYPEYGVAIQFPAAPVVTQVSYPAAGGPASAVVYAVEQETSRFSLTIVTFAGRSNDQRATIEQAITRIRGSGDVKLDVSECISGDPGWEFSVAGKDGSASKMSVFSVGTHLYLLEVTIRPPNVLRDSGDAARFQQSLAFVRGAPQPACRGRAAEASKVSP